MLLAIWRTYCIENRYMSTLKEVAELAGVSVATASLALNHNARIKESTRKKVSACAKALNYVPNRIGRTLKNGKSNAMKNPWFRIGFDAWLLGVEASSVIGLRAFKIAGGGAAAAAEARLMINEKIQAGWALSGALGLTAHRATARTLVHYRRKVRANQRRLAKP